MFILICLLSAFIFKFSTFWVLTVLILKFSDSSLPGPNYYFQPTLLNNIQISFLHFVKETKLLTHKHCIEQFDEVTLFMDL